MPNPLIAESLRSEAAASQLALDAVLRICASVTAPRPLPEILENLLSETRAILNADGGSIYLSHDERLRLVVRQAPGAACDVTHPHNLGALVGRPLDRWIIVPDPAIGPEAAAAAEVARNGHPLNIVDIYRLPSDSPFRAGADASAGAEYRAVSLLGVPMSDRDGNIVGVIELLNRRNGTGEITGFTERDVEALASLAAVAAIAVHNAELHDQLHRSQLDTILRLASAAEFRDGDTGDHIRRMSCYCEAVARQLGYPQEWCRLILFASPMHDVGKLGIPDSILKKPGALTPDERAVMERHTIIGGQLLSGADNDILSMAERIALTHHERWDGRGYPNGLAGDAIAPEGRIAAVADVFDALTNKRIYKPAFPFEEAFSLVQSERGKHFDPAVVDAFFSARGEIEAIYDAYRP